MRYMLLIYAEEAVENALSEDQMGQLMQEYQEFSAELEGAGAFLEGARLRPLETATTVRIRNDEVLGTDGPFAETKEALGGYYLIEAANLDAALDWARKVPSAKLGSVEVRPVWEME